MSIYNAAGSALAIPFVMDCDFLRKAYNAAGETIFDDNGQAVLAWEDDFNSLDQSKWMEEIGLVRNPNTELQVYRSQNVSFENSCLVLTAKRENYAGKEWTSGSITGQTLQRWKFCKIEARIKFPNITGAFGAFWMLGSNFWKDFVEGGAPTNHGELWPKCGEIDITETIPGTIAGARSNVYDYNGTSLGVAGSGTIDPTQFNIYGVIRTAEYIAALVNGVEYHRWTFSNYSAEQIQAYLLPMYPILNLAVGSQGGTPAEETTEMKMYVDWVRVYSPLVA